jgi:hypothetical protein
MKTQIIKFLSLSLLIPFFIGCSDNAISQVHNKKILNSKIECMRVVVFPPNSLIENKLHELYPFKNECHLELVVSYKDSIVCNSNQNSQKKVLGLAKSYLRFELKKDDELMYSYYKDLADNFTDFDVKNAFSSMKKALKF